MSIIELLVKFVNKVQQTKAIPFDAIKAFFISRIDEQTKLSFRRERQYVILMKRLLFDGTDWSCPCSAQINFCLSGDELRFCYPGAIQREFSRTIDSGLDIK